MAEQENRLYQIPEEGSLGLLALGATGLQAWRAKRNGQAIPDLSKLKPTGGKKKLMLIGWDAADWKVIRPLLEAGKMPALKKLMESGVHGNISTLEPILSPMLWTSIGTGKYADKHGILGFSEPDPTTGQVRPVASTSRKVRAIWNILSQQGYKSHLVTWWPSHPAEPINGVCVSNLFQRASAPIDKPWPLTMGMIHPQSLKNTFKELRIHPDELTEAHILPFIPQAAKVDQEKDNGIGTLSKILADCATVQACATWILENQDWDFLGVYFDGIDHFSHSFMRFYPPKMPGLKEEEFEIYKDVVSSAYIFHDMMLERLLDLRGEDTNVILLSDHGFKSDHLRPIGIPVEPAGPAFEHRPFGIICMAGPAFRKNEKISGATLLDVTPTILTLFDLPVGKDMDGVPIIQAFAGEKEVSEIPSWEDVEGDFGMFKEVFREDPFVAKQALDQLADLGYVEKAGDNHEKALKTAETERSYNLARVYLSSGRNNLALPILENLFEEKKEKRFGLHLTLCLTNMGESRKAKEVIEKIRKELKKADFSVDMLEASILIDEKNPKEALVLLEKLRVESPVFPELYVHIGRCYTLLEKYEHSEEAFMQALILDPERAVAHYGVGLSLLRRGKSEEAVEAFLNALSLVYHYPMAHYHLGEALYSLGEKEEAAMSFEVVLVMNPGVTKAKKWLEKIYTEEKHLLKIIPERISHDPVSFGKAQIDGGSSPSIRKFSGKSKGEVVVVSGLPRSGTSMMMQMLEKGGLEILTDDKRVADVSNPRGYFEHEGVKRSASDKRWLKAAVGKAVKVIAQLLIHLPPNYTYKVIFMRREMSEIMESQHKMMVQNGKAKEGEYRSGVGMAFSNALARSEEWAASGPNIQVLNIDYSEVLENGEKTALKISEFLGRPMDIEAMAKTIDRSLHRNKSEKIRPS